MSRSQNLRHNVINQVINDMARGFLPSPLPSQSALAEMYNISRTTVRHILSHLCERGVLRQRGQDYQILRQPEMQDGFDGSSASLAEQNRLFEQAFYTMINQRQLRAGEIFSELQLARAAGVSPVVVREFLLKFSRYNLIESEKRGQWNMKKFEQSWA
ncbi:GntR family transcriptional regulator, partial [Klebsiella michiganensis]